ncbi:MAG: flagellar biosynthesis protein FliQ [Pseudomonadota bacterium]
MEAEAITSIGQQALWVTALLAAPMLLAALGVGLIVGMLQAATQINEMTLSFIPKLLVLVLALSLAAPWMLEIISDFATELITSIPARIG